MRITACSLFLLFISISAYGSEPIVTIDYKESYNGFGTIAGRVTAEAAGPFLVSIDNAGNVFHTLADAEGRFGIVFRHRSIKFDIWAKPFSSLSESVSKRSESLTQSEDPLKR